MEMKVGCAERGHDRLTHGHARQHTAVLPASALNGDRLHPALLEGGLKPVEVKQSGGVRTNLDPGADLFLLRRLLVDVYVNAGPQEGNGRSRSTNTSADNCGCHAGHVTVSLARVTGCSSVCTPSC